MPKQMALPPSCGKRVHGAPSRARLCMTPKLYVKGRCTQPQRVASRQGKRRVPLMVHEAHVHLQSSEHETAFVCVSVAAAETPMGSSGNAIAPIEVSSSTTAPPSMAVATQLGGSPTLEKGGLDLSQPTPTREPQTDDSGGGNDGGGKITNDGGGGDDDDDDDDYFEDEDDDDDVRPHWYLICHLAISSAAFSLS